MNNAYASYCMAKACKIYTLHCDWPMLGANLTVMPMGIMSDVNARMEKREC